MSGLISAANLGGVADPRIGGEADAIGTSYEHRASISGQVQAPDLHGAKTIYLDSSIEFEDYVYWAKRSREVEKHIPIAGHGFAGLWNLVIGKKVPKTIDTTISDQSSSENVNEKASFEKSGIEKHMSTADGSGNPSTDSWNIKETEWEAAQRATRTATWGSIFYLITTDILGPTNVPWAIAQMGYGPGFALYTTLGGLACYSGLQLWKMYCGLDSARYPMRNYGDLAFRIFGQKTRIFINALQSVQFYLNVTLCITQNGQGLAQMAVGKNGKGFLCFIVAEVIFMLCGFILGQIRTLQRLSFLSNLAIWMNVFVIIMTMIVVHSYPPNYAAILTSYGIPEGPVHTSANWPVGSGLMDRSNGMMNAVFAYGGATLFNELMAEMRRPHDFWKGFVIAEGFIYICYLVSGMVTYSAQGQFTFNPAYQGIPNSAYGWQTAGNALSFLSAVIAALLYGNIGVKIFYSAILKDVFNFPPLDSKKGKLIWVAAIPFYWALAFVLAAAVPQISNLTAFVGALTIMQFSYVFPPWFMVAFNCQKDSMTPEETFDPVTGRVSRIDSGWKRWIRGYKKKFAINTFDLLYGFGALAAAGLGLWSSIEGIITVFDKTGVKAFTCVNPAG